MLAQATELPRLLLIVVIPILAVMGVLVFWIKRQNTPKDMRWPRKKQGKRRSERDVSPNDRSSH
tara:strand:+ start:417 stop:608 length:192 start_codon:yes stop_codon:yes gene_type:complete